MKGINALENVATEIRFGDNIAFAGAGGSFGKNWNHADDFVGRTVARVEGAVDGQLGDVVDVERLPELITGTIVTMVEYDKTKIGTKERFKNFPISEKSYYFDLNNVDMEAYEALKDYIRIELEEE